MNIGIFTDVYKPSINGVTSSIESFRGELEKRGHKVYTFCPFVEGAIPEKNVFRLPAIDELSPENFPIGVPFLPIVTKTIKPLKLDIVHTQLPFLVGALGHRAAQKLNLPEIHTYNTLLTEYAHYMPAHLLQPLAKYGLKRLSKNFCNRSDIVIAPSPSIKQVLISYGVYSKIVVNPTGIDVKQFHRISDVEKLEICQEYNIPTDKKIIIFGGRLAQEKNLTFLLDCYEKIILKRKDTFLIYAGGGPSESKLKMSIKSRGLEDDVMVTGFIDHTEIAKLFGIGDIFAFPSITETQGLVISEAMAAGCPVVAINIMGPKDVVENNVNGFLVSNNKKDFSEHITTLLDDEKLREKMSQNAIKCAQSLSIEKCTDGLLSIYEMAIQHKATENQ